MSFMLTRIFTYFTLVLYLVVGSVAVRVLMPEMTDVSISSQYLTLFSKTQIEDSKLEAVEAPEMAFNELKFPVEKKVVAARRVARILPQVMKTPSVMKIEKVAKNELPFYQPVKLSPVVMNQELRGNLVALYKEFTPANIADYSDSVSTQLAATQAEPVFFEYAEEDAVKPASKSEPTQVVHNVDKVENVDSKEEVVAVDDLIAFDYSKVVTDIKNQAMPVYSTVTTQTAAAAPSLSFRTAKSSSSKAAAVATQEEAAEKSALLSHHGHPVKMTIQLTGTNLKMTTQEVGFEIRFQDDLGYSLEDYGSGYVTINDTLSAPRMTRSITALKRGFAPTNTDMILDEETQSLSLPMIEQDKFNELLAPYEARGVMGAVLVELDDSVEGATLDVPYSEVLKLDGDLKVTEAEDFRYELFVGVKAGNALLGYKDANGGVTSKIIHVHERELTFDSNFFEDVADEKVTLMEEDLLSKEKTPLIISSSSVKEFATNRTAKKINNHTYETGFGRVLLGSRKYLELTHQQESVFVGYRDNQTVAIPSENFMRFVLSKFEGANLGNRCLVQVNLTKKAVKVDVAGESVGTALMTYTQVLDADGKFYDSVGPKSRKIIVIGENQGAPEYAQDAKINFKVTYQDGSVQYLGSYCSPNAYLVEQL